MNNNANLIVMLTYNDLTVANACEVFDECKDSMAQFWGFKEKGLPIKDMKALFTYMKDCGKTTVLEVVEYTEAESLKGAEIAVECGCDILMGTCFFDSVNEYCKANSIKYMPFVGSITGRPSVLSGDIDDIISEANDYLEKGVYGFDLLAYRYSGDAELLAERFVSEVNAPVCIAGSIGSYRKLDVMNQLKPWAFTIGGAFFDNKFDGTFKNQIDNVCRYMTNEAL